tara:strand:- start:1487 stop:1879 length:393 start_codon:yes stop_codon:yes gene_type:complete
MQASVPPGYQLVDAQQPKIKEKKTDPKKPDQVVMVSVSATSKEPGQAVAQTPSISDKFAARLLDGNKASYRPGQVVSITDGKEEYHFKRSGDKMVTAKLPGAGRRSGGRKRRSGGSGTEMSSAEVSRGAF